MAASKNIRLAVVEDHQVVRKALVKMLNEKENYDVVIEASNGQEFLDKIAKKNSRCSIARYGNADHEWVTSSSSIKKKWFYDKNCDVDNV
jgi:DNA-binding NarL/FixJ family response regulator